MWSNFLRLEHCWSNFLQALKICANSMSRLWGITCSFHSGSPNRFSEISGGTFQKVTQQLDPRMVPLYKKTYSLTWPGKIVVVYSMSPTIDDDPQQKKTKPGFSLRLGFSLSVSAPPRCGRLWGSAQTDGVQSLVRDPLVLVRGARVKRGCLGLAYQPQTDRKNRKYKNYQELVICEDHHLHLQHMQPPCLPSLLGVKTKVIRIRMCWTCYLPHVWGYLFTYT